VGGGTVGRAVGSDVGVVVGTEEVPVGLIDPEGVTPEVGAGKVGSAGVAVAEGGDVGAGEPPPALWAANTAL
jgi:hypothetical protein